MATETLARPRPGLRPRLRAGTLHRTGLLVRHNALLRLRDPGQLISYIVLPMIIMVVFKPLYTRALSTGTLQAVTGPLIMFSVFALAIVGNSIFIEREWRTWDRVRATQAGQLELLLGKTVPILAVLLLQQIVLLSFGCLVVGLPFPRSIGWVVLAVTIWGLTLLAAGSALATVVRSRGDLGLVSDLGAMLVSALGGALVPVALMPIWVQHIAPLSPGYWGISLLRAAIAGDPGSMVEPALVCGAIALAAGTLAAWRLSRGWNRSHLI